MTRPFLPSDLPRPSHLRDWAQATAAKAIGQLSRGEDHAEIARKMWGDRIADVVQRSAVSPASSTGWGAQLDETVVGDFLQSLRPFSAVSQLFAAGTRLDLSTSKSVLLPARATNFPKPSWVAEGAPIPTATGALNSVTLGPLKKLAYIVTLTGELDRSTNAADVIDLCMREATAQALEASVFSTDPATDARPAGILSGVAPIAGSANMLPDLGKLMGAIGDNGGGASVQLFANPRQAVSVTTAYDKTLVSWVPSLPAGTIVAVETGAFVSAFGGLPEIDAAKETLIHTEDTSPAQIGTAGSPNVAASPMHMLWQTDCTALRAIQRATWAMRGTGLVQVINGATW